MPGLARSVPVVVPRLVRGARDAREHADLRAVERRAAEHVHALAAEADRAAGEEVLVIEAVATAVPQAHRAAGHREPARDVEALRAVVDLALGEGEGLAHVRRAAGVQRGENA